MMFRTSFPSYETIFLTACLDRTTVIMVHCPIMIEIQFAYVTILFIDTVQLASTTPPMICGVTTTRLTPEHTPLSWFHHQRQKLAPIISGMPLYWESFMLRSSIQV